MKKFFLCSIIVVLASCTQTAPVAAPKENVEQTIITAKFVVVENIELATGLNIKVKDRSEIKKISQGNQILIGSFEVNQLINSLTFDIKGQMLSNIKLRVNGAWVGTTIPVINNTSTFNFAPVKGNVEVFADISTNATEIEVGLKKLTVNIGTQSLEWSTDSQVIIQNSKVQ